MRRVSLGQARTRLSRLVAQAARGEPFIIARAGKPLVKVVPLDARPATQAGRTCFMIGEISVPDDFDRLGHDDIARLFGVGR